MSADTHAALYDRPAELLQRLIRFDTTNPPGNERACIEWIAGILGDAGLDLRILAKDPARPNLIARLPGQGLAPPLLLQGHVDARWRSAGSSSWRISPSVSNSAMSAPGGPGS
jgi:acetylornithine deacetylase/succinyl-diaminopimelate desuccinylase-like protein